MGLPGISRSHGADNADPLGAGDHRRIPPPPVRSAGIAPDIPRPLVGHHHRWIDDHPDDTAPAHERFCTALDCVDIGFLPDHTLDELPTASQIGATRVGGIDLNRARMRSALAAVLALAAAPHGFTVPDSPSRSAS